MVNEPERPIEKLLRECAQKRREEAPDAPGFELHPATRRLLQGEVARRFPGRGEAGSGSSRPWLKAFWPRLVEGCVLVALVAVVGSVLVPALRKPKGQMTLAKNEMSGPARGLAKSMPAPAAPTPAIADEELKRQTYGGPVASADAPTREQKAPSLKPEGNRAERDKDATSALGSTLTAGARRALTTGLAQNEPKLGDASGRAAATPAAPPAAGALGVQAETSAGTPVAPSASPAEMPAGAPATSSTNFGLAENKPAGSTSNTVDDRVGGAGFAFKSLDGGAGPRPPGSLARSYWAPAGSDAAKETKQFSTSQRFTQVPPAMKAKAALEKRAGPAVLASFQVEQSGRELKVIDSDGSVYAGYVQELEAATRTRSVDSVAAAGAKASNAPAREDLALADRVRPPGMPVLFFRVTGTNRSLGQPVVFSGNMTRLTNAAVSGNLGSVAPGQGGASQAAPGQPGSVPLLNTRLSGKVVIGRGRPTELNALPAP